jgi:type I restriction-modification system DNA methylase subunit
MDNATAALAKMNMILHDNPTAEIWRDNSLSNPYFKQGSGNKQDDKNLKTFDFVVANPPFSSKAWSNGFDPAHDLYQRFEDGVPPRKNGDYAFLAATSINVLQACRWVAEAKHAATPSSFFAKLVASIQQVSAA